jgi:hypothetical protein
MTDQEIFKRLVFGQVECSGAESDRLFEQMEIFAFDFGDYQFNEYSFIIINSHGGKVAKILIYKMGEEEQKLYSFEVGTTDFLSIYKKFIGYAHDTGLKKEVPFLPKDYSLDEVNS